MARRGPALVIVGLAQVALAVGVSQFAIAAPLARGSSCGPSPALGLASADSQALVGVLDPELRLRWIDAELTRGGGRARLWTWSWGIALGVGTIANLAPLPFVKPDERIDWYTGAVTTAVGIVPLLIAPLDVIADSRALRSRIAARDGAQDDVCALLADAETRLVRDAQNQADGRRWWLHAGNVVLNAGVGLFLIVGFHHWAAGIFNAASGAAIGEMIILTQPTGAIESLRRYRTGALDGAAPPTTVSFAQTF
ncbi:MAG TPA: hypothetical protein VMT47_06565 [Polyangia bacterium]|nr:hypothetical protein [Polyangia bacterium]